MIALLLAAALVQPAPLPDAPKPMDHATWSLIAADASVRALDVYSTHYMLHEWCLGPLGEYHCHVERIWPAAVAKSTPAMIAASSLIVLGNALTAKYLIRHHRPRLAKIVLAIDIVADGALGVNNLFLESPYSGGK